MMSASIFARPLGAVEESCKYSRSLNYQLEGMSAGALKKMSLCWSFLFSQRDIRNNLCKKEGNYSRAKTEQVKRIARSMPKDFERLAESFLNWIASNRSWRMRTISDTEFSDDIFSEFPCEKDFSLSDRNFSDKSRSERAKLLNEKLAEDLEKERQASIAPPRLENVNQLTNKIRDKVKRHFSWAGDKTDLVVAYQVSLSRTGDILNLRVIESSQDSSFDKAVAQAIYLSQPLPVPKDEADFLRHFDPLLIRFSL
jgi:hypothetical protein